MDIKTDSVRCCRLLLTRDEMLDLLTVLEAVRGKTRQMPFWADLSDGIETWLQEERHRS